MIETDQMRNLRQKEMELDARGLKCVLFVGVAKDGPKIWVETPANIASIITPVVPYAPLEFLEGMKGSVLKAIRYYREKYKESSQDFESLRRKLNREIEDRKEHIGRTYVPSEVVKNTYYSDSLVKSWEKEGIISEGSQIELVDNYENILALRESGYIQDAINSYVQDYYDNSGEFPKMKLAEDGKYFVITDTFDEFCKRGEISSEVKNDVKEALFPSQQGKQGLLERVPFVVPGKDGKKRIMEVRYISARAVIKDPNPDKRIMNLKRGKDKKMQPDSSNRIELFNIDVHAGLFNFLRHTRELRDWESPSMTTGFQAFPKNLSAKIDRQLKLIGTFKNPAYGTPAGIGATDKNPLYAGTKTKTDHEKYRKGISYCTYKWHTGSERKTDMVVTWNELRDNCGFPAHTKRKMERKSEMEELRKMLNAMVRFNEAFDGCDSVELTKAPLCLTFTLAKKQTEQGI